MDTRNEDDIEVAVIGLGYVGLPLAVAFGSQLTVTGFDIDATRIGALRTGHDATGEVDDAVLRAVPRLTFTDNADDLRRAHVYIVTVPTPIDAHKHPDFTPLIEASRTVAGVLEPGDVVIYESTVYPGATEEICVPVLAEGSGLVCN